MSVLWSVLRFLGEIPSFNTLRSVNVGSVQWNTEEFTRLLLPFLSAAPNLEEFTIFDTDSSNKNLPLYRPDFIGQVF